MIKLYYHYYYHNYSHNGGGEVSGWEVFLSLVFCFYFTYLLMILGERNLDIDTNDKSIGRKDFILNLLIPFRMWILGIIRLF